MTGLKILLAVRGDLREHAAQERRNISRASRVAPAKAAALHKERARAEVRRGFNRSAGRRGRKVENAIRDKVYSDGEFKHAAIVYSKFGRRERGKFVDYFAPYAHGATIKAKGKYMVIPAKGTSRRVNRVLRDLKRLDEDPKLALIPQSGGRFIFVRHSSKRRTVIIAWLIRRFRRKKTLDFVTLEHRIERELPEIYLRELEAQP